MTDVEFCILQNQKCIMDALSWILIPLISDGGSYVKDKAMANAHLAKAINITGKILDKATEVE